MVTLLWPVRAIAFLNAAAPYLIYLVARWALLRIKFHLRPIQEQLTGILRNLEAGEPLGQPASPPSRREARRPPEAQGKPAPEVKPRPAKPANTLMNLVQVKRSLLQMGYEVQEVDEAIKKIQPTADGKTLESLVLEGLQAVAWK